MSNLDFLKLYVAMLALVTVALLGYMSLSREESAEPLPPPSVQIGDTVEVYVLRVR